MCRKVLIIEDNKTLNYLLSKKIQFSDEEVISCFDGKEAMEVLRNQIDDIKIVISDINLPHASGLEILEFVRKELNSDIHFIATSVNKSIYMKELFYELNGNVFLDKPYSIDNLLIELKQITQNTHTIH